MMKRAIALVAMLAGLSLPTAAHADGSGCTQVPVDTVGAHLQVGDEEVHVPAISNAALCVTVYPIYGGPIPVHVTVYQFCGTVCFRATVDEGQWPVASTRVVASLYYEVDGAPVTVPLLNTPIGLTVNNQTPVCLAVGNPIPECPSNYLVVPIPAP